MITNCKPQTLLESATVDIQHCPDCQMFHLTMGAVTIRMSEHHFSQFAQDISRGLAAFHSSRADGSGWQRIM